MHKKNFVFFLFIASFIIFSSCNSNTKTASLKEEKLFTLQYGMFENEIRMVDSNTANFSTPSIYMEDGMFYIEDTIANKIMVLSSYGDLIQIIYNTNDNPIPSFLEDSSSSASATSEKSDLVTQKAIEYPFIQLGSITVDEQKNLYVADFLPPDRYKEEDSSFLRQVVLRFKANGTFIDYLGQEGPGGTPFPYIDHLYTTNNNELVVVCKTTIGYRVYWYTTDGFLKYTIPIETTNLPKIESEDNVEQYVLLTQIVPDNNEEKLYLKIDYQVTERDESSNVQSSIVLKETALYPLNVATGIYEKPLIIPPFEQTDTDGYTKTVHNLAYDFLGLTDSGWFFFTIGDETGYSILMVQPNGQKIVSHHLDIDLQETLYQPFCLSREGIISSMIVTKKEAKVCWWRTDTILASF